jgi:hypothetical protein
MAARTREKRQTLTEKPFDEMDEAARGQSREGGGADALKRAAMTAGAGAIVAGLAGATKALLERRSSQTEAEPADEPAEEGEEHDSRPIEPPDPLDQAAEPEADQEAEDADADADAEQRPRAEAPESDDGDDDGSEGAPAGEAAQIVRQARRELANLLGSKPEGVSGLEHADGRWSVTFEVVELRRVPESTDVLSSYEVVIDDEGNLVSARRLRRYRRSQVEEVG